MNRRKFIQRASLLSLPLLLGRTTLSALSQPALEAAMNDDDRVLVLLRLAGGNDGLNTVIPRDQYAGIMGARPNLAIPENKILNIEDTLALHPNMMGMRRMYGNGDLAIVQGVGYPEQNRSHFRSTDIMQTASESDEILTTGWLGRQLDNAYPGFPAAYPDEKNPDPFAIVMGDSVSETCQGQAGNFSIALNGLGSIGQLPTFAGGPTTDTPYGEELDWLRTTIAQNNQYATGIQAAAGKGNNVAEYPTENQLAGRLRDVAKLISGGLRTKIYIIELGGFDTHADQVMPGNRLEGRHGVLLTTLSDAIASFQADLAALNLEKRVLGMTFSEFGRRIKSNDSDGSDHGDAAPLFLFGSCVTGGVTGDNAEIAPDVHKAEGVPMQYDFRNVYGSVLQDWFGVKNDTVRSLLIDDFEYIPLLGACSTVSTTDAGARNKGLRVQPNPAHDEVSVSFTTGAERMRVSLYDAFGRQVLVGADRGYSAGEQRVDLSLRELPAGVYFVHLMGAGGVRQVRRVVKQ